ncbi:hypothetical protein BDW71DRAFT_82829 [Aspergillus fruticulosus]
MIVAHHNHLVLVVLSRGCFSSFTGGPGQIIDAPLGSLEAEESRMRLKFANGCVKLHPFLEHLRLVAFCFLGEAEFPSRYGPAGGSVPWPIFDVKLIDFRFLFRSEKR